MVTPSERERLSLKSVACCVLPEPSSLPPSSLLARSRWEALWPLCVAQIDQARPADSGRVTDADGLGRGRSVAVAAAVFFCDAELRAA